MATIGMAGFWRPCVADKRYYILFLGKKNKIFIVSLIHKPTLPIYIVAT